MWIRTIEDLKDGWAHLNKGNGSFWCETSYEHLDDEPPAKKSKSTKGRSNSAKVEKQERF